MQNDEQSKTFYATLPAFDSFRDVAELDRYTAFPDDWELIISDIRGSTEATQGGGYKNVNMVGAASIISVLNACDDTDLPFAFGGDGGLIAVPPAVRNSAITEIRRLQAASSSMFGLDLRAAAIPIGVLRAEGADTLVRKYRLSAGNTLAMFAGEGPAKADEWLKTDTPDNPYLLKPADQDLSPNLDGLTCRWEPLKSRNGTMLTIIVLPRDGDAGAELNSITDGLVEILGGPVNNFAPAHDDTLHYRFPPSGLRLEIAAGARQASWFRRATWAYFTAFMQLLCERWGLKIGDYDGSSYRAELKQNTDYRKFDGHLRMVLDVTEDQADRLEERLEGEYQAGRIVYGTFRADHALMTCLLFDLEESRHIHLIDGGNGGYTQAAVGLKKRLAAIAG